MSIIDTTTKLWIFNRERTLATLDTIAELDDPQGALSYRPGTGRAHIAWQLMHIGVTEQIFATERLKGTQPNFADLIPRFRGGSTPDDIIPTLDSIREVLSTSREQLLETVSEISEDDLETIPEAFQDRGWTLGTILQIVSWHECHHQGQAHLTLNLYKAEQ
ncbi:DinB superfamily protein [Symmachiella dynata]|uniref:DinB superfamily protein n=1 Tax=Symmachiella dynata TaxID=2527995 RepID=A0A517ZSE4_9PLAN|nr:DinB family protein [Symmachiella dynata]QDU45422.1 DinB superfamily protein [Symmachiella dynata]